jgi:hypothetical protein
VFCVVGQNNRGSTIHTAGACVTGRSVAKSSSAFRVRIHIAGVCVTSRNVAKGSFAFRSRANDTWGVSPWESRSSPGNKRNAISNEVAFLCFAL